MIEGTIEATALWRRLDGPGHDACWLVRTAEGWCLDGTAVFAHLGGPAVLRYAIRCDLSWRTLHGSVDGRIGDRAIRWDVTHRGGLWTCNGRQLDGLGHLDQLDLSFTPATNIMQVRRLAEAASTAPRLMPVVWLDIDADTLTELPQIYRPQADGTIGYSAPSVGYEGRLTLAESGFIAHYPGLWIAEL